MQCSVCQHEMVPSKVGLLCPNCGHFEPAPADQPATPAKITLGSTAPTSSPAAPPDAAEPAEQPVIVPSAEPEPIAEPELASQATSAARLIINPPEYEPEPESEPAAQPISPPSAVDLPSSDLIPASEAKPSVEPIIPAAMAATSQPEPLPEPEAAPLVDAVQPPAETAPPADAPPPIGLKLPTDPLPPAASSVMPPATAPATPHPPGATAEAAASSVMPGLPNDAKAAPSASPKPKWLKPLIAVVAVLVIGGGALAYKAFIFDAQQAPAAYLQKLFSAKTGQFSAAASYSSPQDASSLITGDLSLAANGSYDVSNPQMPKSDVALTVKYSGSSLGGEVITLPKTAYFKITQLGFLSSLGVSLAPGWYQYPINSESSTSDCNVPHSKSGRLFGLSFPNSLPLKHASRVGLFTTIAGHSTTHFTGDVDMSKLQHYVDAANAQLPADCKIALDASTANNTTVHYDIWRGSDFDRSSFTVTTNNPTSKLTLTLNSQNYNQPVNIQAPAGAKPLDSLLSSFEDTSGSVGATPSAD